MARCACGTEKLVLSKYLAQGKSKSCGCHGIFPGVRIDGFEVIKRGASNSPTTFRCEHGVEFESRIENGRLRIGGCPCTRFDRSSAAISRHGESPHSIRTREYNCWRSMRQRCNDPKNRAYKHYGGRGIRVCERWSEYINFLADMGRCPEGMTLDRIEVNGNYELGNCRWADDKTQSANRRNVISARNSIVCKRGHLWTMANTAYNSLGSRQCKTCIKNARNMKKQRKINV